MAVSGAPVTLWFNYDTGYTERYLGLVEGEGEVSGRGEVSGEGEASRSGKRGQVGDVVSGKVWLVGFRSVVGVVGGRWGQWEGGVVGCGHWGSMGSGEVWCVCVVLVCS